ncbi:MAG: type II toxin-antitoxin system HicB family antitoxin [Candidatus Taylorbacteria bacterium]|nr:type II toxin-antitoxin system HicB family antitoxin [Candidatus Taylorbacteria bacterium]
MKKTYLKDIPNKQFPVFLERDEDGVYIVECPVFSGCYSQGKTIDQALKKIKEVIHLCLEEKDNQDRARSYIPGEMSLHTVSV